jgi:hypothetical protein
MTTPDPTGDALKAGPVVGTRTWCDADGVWHEQDITAEEFYRETRTPATEAGVSLEEVVEVLTECADELEVEVRARWGDDPRLAGKLTRDLDTVVKARAILTRIKNEAPRD